MAGDAEKKLEVISYVKEEQVEEIKQFLEQTPITVEHLESVLLLILW
mgnify:CR=1 FL=1